MPPRATPTACLLLAALLIGAGGGAVSAMGIRHSKTELARAADGATLYELRGDGPEGGGSIAYRVQGRAPRDRVDFLVSSDFSPGGGARPQTVSAEICRQRIDALGAELAKHAFAGVRLHPEACRTAERAGLLTVDKPAPPAAKP